MKTGTSVWLGSCHSSSMTRADKQMDWRAWSVKSYHQLRIWAFFLPTLMTTSKGLNCLANYDEHYKWLNSDFWLNSKYYFKWLLMIHGQILIQVHGLPLYIHTYRHSISNTVNRIQTFCLSIFLPVNLHVKILQF